MTRDQAQKIANDIFDAAESAGHLSKDLVVDAIFNSWHKQTSMALMPYNADPHYIGTMIQAGGFSHTPRFTRNSDMQLDD
jgi:hypothetical protein